MKRLFKEYSAEYRGFLFMATMSVHVKDVAKIRRYDHNDERISYVFKNLRDIYRTRNKKPRSLVSFHFSNHMSLTSFIANITSFSGGKR